MSGSVRGEERSCPRCGGDTEIRRGGGDAIPSRTCTECRWWVEKSNSTSSIRERQVDKLELRIEELEQRLDELEELA